MGKKSKAEKTKIKGPKQKIDLSSAPEAIDDEPSGQVVAAALVQAARSMRTVMSRNLVESGLYAGQDGVMLALAEEDGMTAGGLAARLGVKAPTMTRTIGRMEAQGFLHRRADDEDARLTKVYLTEEGRARLDAIAEAGRQTGEQALRGFSDKQIKLLMKLLRSLDANLQNGALED
ncbi:MarR family transcriptional regulator [Xaviernesmea oryzae]|uniref:MarR family transcriptional regulator n=1 Tax=Xaviernesmea oryzae TaxID=464029 RepID=A0A1Q9AZ74_9HYPH|nr:MarR family transcriptional regulator [Xaviernesmea oryzae]OLP60995.1 MarR family transcriptional regulator [Xaviernesmea oryzae]SEL18227.1 DNA-binding transcriptional regulator, MarR family [Xaviernesmea oryzae]